MSEPARGTSAMDEICQHLTALNQAVKSLQEGYVQLEERVQSLATSLGPTTALSPAAAPTLTTTAPTVMMLPPEPRVPTPERFSGDRSKFRAFRNACQLYFALQPPDFLSGIY